MNLIQTAEFAVIDPSLTQEFLQLFRQFLDTFYASETGKKHNETYIVQRETGRRNWKQVQELLEQGKSATEAVLLKLLPYNDNVGNRQREAWIHNAPVFSTDVRVKQEAIGWRKPEDWDAVAAAIAEFVRVCINDPSNLDSACQSFIKLPYIKGFQAETLSPILNALYPSWYTLINDKSRKVINYFTQKNYKQNLSDYCEANKTALEFQNELAVATGCDPVSAGDLFDMFSHWMVSQKKFFQQGELGKPFSDMFENMEQASWALDWIRFTVHTLGINGPDDVRMAISVPKSDIPRSIHFIIGNWMVLGFYGNRAKPQSVQIALLQEAREKYENIKYSKAKQFSTDPGLGPIFLYNILYQNFIENEDDIRKCFVETLGVIKGIFGNWKMSNLRDTNNSKLASAIFTPDREEAILQQGVLEPGSSGDGETSGGIGGSSRKPGELAFSVRAFELLEGIHNQPRLSYYNEHKEEFKAEIELPFQDLLRRVASRLPDSITKLMETEKKIVSRFAKNDYGLGGAWDHYWGAFYPKGSKRTTDAQLALFWSYCYFQISFYIGDYGSEVRARFKKNCSLLKDDLHILLKDIISDPSLLIMSHDKDFTVLPDGRVEPNNLISWESFFSDAAAGDYGIRLTLSPQQILRMTAAELEDLAVASFKRFFPLVILSQSDNPLEELQNWLPKDEEAVDIIGRSVKSYKLADCVADTGFNVEMLDSWLRAIERKKQAILYGPPGTGKTFIARALAKVLTNGEEDRIDLVQFHPAYSYEDFIQGIRPKSIPGGLDYPIVPGRFIEFCRRAQNQEGTCVLIVDEINRANLSRVFGELMYLLEYRNEEIELASGGSRFRIPENVRLIGTMNTADRSIALVDHALRRRFAFLALAPNFEILQKYHVKEGTGFPVDSLIRVLRNLNSTIKDPHYEVGISFFLRPDLKTEIADIWKMEIEPYLEEYFFEDNRSVESFRWNMVKPQLGL